MNKSASVRSVLSPELLEVRALRAAATSEHASLIQRAFARGAFQCGVRAGAGTTRFRSGQLRTAYPGLQLRVGGDRIPVEHRVLHGLRELRVFDLLVDLPGQRVVVYGREFPWTGRTLTLRILAALVLARGRTLSRSALFEYAWERPFNPLYDENPLYVCLTRLRRQLGDTQADEGVFRRAHAGYRLRSGLSAAVIEFKGPKRRIPFARPAIHLAEMDVIDNRTYRRFTHTSRATARRRLQTLVASGDLIREGHGRSTVYRRNRIHERAP